MMHFLSTVPAVVAVCAIPGVSVVIIAVIQLRNAFGSKTNL